MEEAKRLIYVALLVTRASGSKRGGNGAWKRGGQDRVFIGEKDRHGAEKDIKRVRW